MAINKINSIFCMVLFIVLILISGCKVTNSNEVPHGNDQIRTINAKVITDDSLIKPLAIKAGKSKATTVKSLEYRPLKDNSLPYPTPKPLKISHSNVIKVGEDGIPMPEVIVVKHRGMLVGMPVAVEANDPSVRLFNPYNFSSISKLQGLRHEQVRDFTFDTTGNMWLATDDGLTKYDGKFLTTYTTEHGLTDNLLLSVFHSSKNDLWIGTFRGGAIKFDGKELTYLGTEQGMPSNIINWITQDDQENIWLATGMGLIKYDGHNITIYNSTHGLPNNDIRYIAFDKSGKLWVSTRFHGVSCFDGTSFTNYSKNEGLPEEETNALYSDKQGNMWIGLASKGAVKVSDNLFYHYNFDAEAYKGRVTNIYEDSTGDYWFATFQNGVYRLSDSSLFHYNREYGLVTNNFRVIKEDHESNIWLSTRNAGIIKYKGKSIKHLIKETGLSSNRVYSMLERENGELWVGTFDGYVTILRNYCTSTGNYREVSYFNRQQGLNDPNVYSIIEDSDGKIWLGTSDRGVFCFDGKQTYNYTKENGLVDNLVRVLYQTNDSSIWIGTYGGGVSKFDGTTFTNYTTRQGLSSNNIMSIFQDSNGIIWFGTDGGGLTAYNGSYFSHYTTNEGFFNNTVFCITQDCYGTLWFGTSGDGVISYDGTYFTKHNINEVLNNNHILSLLSDSNNLFATSRYGLNEILVDSAATIQKIKSYDFNDGFTGLGGNLNSIIKLNSGPIAIGTNDRLSFLFRENQAGYPDTLALQLTSVIINNEDIPWNRVNNYNYGDRITFSGINKWSNTPVGLKLDYRYNNVTLKYNIISTSHSKKTRYQYMLSGIDQHWSQPSSSTAASYTNLPPGRYIFKVKAIYGDTKLVSELDYNFTITPPWWQTKLFYLMAILALALSVFLTIKIREQNLKIRNRRLEERVNEQTQNLLKINRELTISNKEREKFLSIMAHDLKNHLGAIIGFSEVLKNEISTFSQEEIASFAAQINLASEAIYGLFENLLHWTKLQQKSIKLLFTKINIHDIIQDNITLAQHLANNKEITITSNIPGDMIVETDAGSLNTIIRNLISNAIKFTERGGSIHIKAEYGANDTVTLSVIDTGIGINNSVVNTLFDIDSNYNRQGTEGESSTGLGLLICKELAEAHYGSITVKSEEGKGSEFIITLPIYQQSSSNNS